MKYVLLIRHSILSHYFSKSLVKRSDVQDTAHGLWYFFESKSFLSEIEGNKIYIFHRYMFLVPFPSIWIIKY